MGPKFENPCWVLNESECAVMGMFKEATSQKTASCFPCVPLLFLCLANRSHTILCIQSPVCQSFEVPLPVPPRDLPVGPVHSNRPKLSGPQSPVVKWTYGSLIAFLGMGYRIWEIYWGRLDPRAALLAAGCLKLPLSDHEDLLTREKSQRAILRQRVAGELPAAAICVIPLLMENPVNHRPCGSFTTAVQGMCQDIRRGNRFVAGFRKIDGGCVIWFLQLYSVLRWAIMLPTMCSCSKVFCVTG